jgi:hypothetical protein
LCQVRPTSTPCARLPSMSMVQNPKGPLASDRPSTRWKTA